MLDNHLLHVPNKYFTLANNSNIFYQTQLVKQAPRRYYLDHSLYGSVAERFKALVLKTSEGETLP